jgi:hypothetical protein
MSGLRRICKTYGGITIQGVKWVWDYAKDAPVKKSEQTKEEWAASERVKWGAIKKHIEKGPEQDPF